MYPWERWEYFSYNGITNNNSAFRITSRQIEEVNLSVLSCFPYTFQIFQVFSKVLECTRDIKLGGGKRQLSMLIRKRDLELTAS